MVDPFGALHRQDGILVLGIGNILWADEGFGVRAVEALDASWRFPPRVRLMDGGTQGLALLPYVRAVSKLLIFDAVDFGLAPGAVCSIRDGDVPQYLGAKKLSMHQTGFQEVLAAARMLGEYPDRLALIGVQPVELDDYGGGLRPEVQNCIPWALGMAVDMLAGWGAAGKRREKEPAASQPPPIACPTEW
ncbi:MAG: HyaD/HybD family hydrogenase maturation endopeptidase [Gammaproteobacteria bacterium]|nr:HyaD/HybD family hydrogenase maturation endopeptidase [Gammaproteobacteria bacterium]